MIESLLSLSSTPVLERMIEFSGRRHRVLVENIANLDTPGYVMKDLPVDAFQAAMRKAIDGRRRSRGSELPPMNGRYLMPLVDQHNYVLFHDGNNRSVEKQMAALAENAMVHNGSIEILRKQFSTLEAAIRERL